MTTAPLEKFVIGDFATILKTATNFYGDIQLKKEQEEVLQNVYEGRDCIAVLPTGFGKSVIFHLIPFLFQPRTAIVVAPISALMEDQLRSLSELDINACSISMDGVFFNIISKEDKSVKFIDFDGFNMEDFRLVYVHPETVTTKSKLRKLLLKKKTQQQVCCVVIDEVHMVSEWGESFRPSFSKLGELTAIFPRIPHLALTATATPKCIDHLCEILQLREVKLVTSNPDRPNIFYEIKMRLPNVKKYDKYDDLILPLCTELKFLKSAFPVTICYMDSLESLAYCYQFTEEFLGEEGYDSKEHIPENRIFAMFHKDYTSRMKSYIVTELRKPDPKIRLVLATVALGMGLNAPGVVHIVHFRPPTSLEKYMQESGRAGRGGQPSKATLYYNNSDIAANRPGMTNEMRLYCKNNAVCLRSLLVKHFGFSVTLFKGEKQDCCSVCKNGM